MNTELRQPLSELAKGRTLSVHNGRGRAIVVFSGLVWVTQDDDPRDIMLGAGESFRIERDGLTLAMALRDSRVMLLDAEPAPPIGTTLSHVLALRARAHRSAAIGDALLAAAAWLARAFGHTLGSARAAAPAVPATPATVRQLTVPCGTGN